MLDLKSPHWKKLRHAKGGASDIPVLLQQLADYPDALDPNAEPFNSLWNLLCRQGDTYTASYAAVPHILNYAKAEPQRMSTDYLLLPVAIEISRSAGRGPELTDKLLKPHMQAIQQLPTILSSMNLVDTDETWALIVSASMAAATGHVKLADAILSMEGDTIDQFFAFIEQQ